MQFNYINFTKGNQIHFYVMNLGYLSSMTTFSFQYLKATTDIIQHMKKCGEDFNKVTSAMLIS